MNPIDPQSLTESHSVFAPTVPQAGHLPHLPEFAFLPTAAGSEALGGVIGFVWQHATAETPLTWSQTGLERSINLPQATASIVDSGLSTDSFRGKAEQTLRIFTGWSDVPQLVLIGLGKIEDATHEVLRRCGGVAGKQLRQLKVEKGGMLVPAQAPTALTASAGCAALVEGTVMGTYQFTHYQSQQATDSESSEANHLKHVQIYHLAGDKTGFEMGAIRGKAICLTRDLGNHPPNVMTPTRMAAEAHAIAKRNHLTCTVLEQADMEALGMGLLLGVARGSVHPPKLVIFEYSPANPTGTIAFVGKGITFDTGGISLKPSPSMEEMKFDMSGAGAVFGAMEAIGQLKPGHRVIGITPICENMPDGNAIKPGDILPSHAGKRVEVLNTDAEGRLVLADALSYVVQHYKPQAVVDLATLTGACVVALGHYATGAIGNNDAFTQQVVEAGKRAGDVIWPLPNFPEYEKSLKSKYADLQNIGGRDAGTITGGLFLKPFVHDTPWVHLDIAGTAWGVKDIGHAPKQGATGVGVAVLIELALGWKPPQ